MGIVTPYVTRLFDNNYGQPLWLLDLASHWQWLYLAGIAAFSGYLSIHNRRWAVAFLATPIPFFLAAPSLPPPPTAPIERGLNIASANAHLDNTDATRLHHWIISVSPEIVVVSEVSPGFGQQLDLMFEYPHRIINSSYDPFGIALLSKLPIKDSSVVKDNEGIPHISATLMMGNQPIRIAAIHPMPPISTEYHQARDEKLLALVKNSMAGGVPALIAGDFNATPWSTAFTGLDNLGWHRASGLRPTWPFWGHGVFGIPIDHVIASSQWRLLGNTVGPDIGSDHYPILVRLSLDSG
ncbi:endonuclease/exonuclease/phosphatase family protein [Methylomagnum sp.]